MKFYEMEKKLFKSLAVYGFTTPNTGFRYFTVISFLNSLFQFLYEEKRLMDVTKN